MSTDEVEIPNNQQIPKISVVTTNSILEDMVKNVVKDRVELYSIVQRGMDPHEYEPKPEDISKATDATVLFHNGLNLETGGSGWFKKLVSTAHKEFDKDVFTASEGVTPEHLTTNVEEEDPHAWLDLANGVQYVKTITKVLKEKDSKMQIITKLILMLISKNYKSYMRKRNQNFSIFLNHSVYWSPQRVPSNTSQKPIMLRQLTFGKSIPNLKVLPNK